MTENIERRQPGEPMESWRERRIKAVADLTGGLPAEGGGLLAEIAALRAEFEEMKMAVSGEMQAMAPKPRKVTLEDGRTFAFAERDSLALALAMFVSFRTGGAVDIPLADGTVAEKLRAGELAEIARQLLGG